MRTTVAAVALLVLVGCETGPLGASATEQQSEVDRLLAPIALYPDQLIAQMLLCASDPKKIAELDTFLAANATLKGTALQDAATVQGFEPSFVALALFPQVVTFMAERLDWTTQLGRAFASDKSAVFDSIQRLRAQAEKTGALKDTPQQNVENQTTSSGQQVIVIEPANPQIIYVPQYDPQVVYVEDDDDDAEAAVAGLIGFTAGVALGAAIDNDYYYGPWGWHGGVHMYNDAWDDWYDAREDAREDWIDHREDLVEERGDLARDAGEQRTERAENRQSTRTETGAQRTERQETRQENRPARTTTSTQASRGDSRDSAAASTASTRTRSSSSSDAFSGYSSGRSERAASTRGQGSRGASRSGGGRRR
jgi:hypothetical protein